MSSTDSSPLSRGETTPPRYYSSNAARRLTGIGMPTIVKYLAPDAVSVSIKGDRLFPLWLESTLLAWAREFRATRGETARERQAYPNRREAQGGER